MSYDDLPFGEPTTPPNLGAPAPKPCRRHDWERQVDYTSPSGFWVRCVRCRKVQDEARSRRNTNNGKRGRKAELDVAKAMNGRKVGPMGWPWDVEMPGYARLQVRKLKTPPSLRAIAKALDAIEATPGPEMGGYVWLEPGRNGEQLITFRLKPFAANHGLPKLDGGDDD